MNRIGIFQFYNECGLVESYIEELLRSMLFVLSKLIIVCNGNLTKREFKKLEQYSDEIYIRENFGYDAGAYKEVYLELYQEDWKRWDEIVLFNCTFYGPIFPWQEVFERMDQVKVDFWGLSRHAGKEKIRKNGRPAPEHLQSYFLVIKEKMMHSIFFKNFWEILEYPKNYCEAIEYFEWKFVAFFKEKGFKYTSWLDVQGGAPYITEGVNPCTTYTYKIVKDCKFPIIKCKSISIVNCAETKKVLDFVRLHTSYNVDLIISHIRNLNAANKWKPFSIGVLENFVNAHTNIYIFGHGKYGQGLEIFFRNRNWKIEAYIVSIPQQENEIAFEDFKMNEKDGLIVALGMLALEEVGEKIKERFEDNQLLFPYI